MMTLTVPKLQREDTFACAQCGYCVRPCPIYDQLGWESTSPRGKIFFLKKALGVNLGTPDTVTGKIVKSLPSLFVRKDKGVSDELLAQFVKRLYSCTLCGRCSHVCHLELNLEELWVKLREIAVENGVAPPIITQVRDSILNKRNVFAMDSELRNDWTVYTGAEASVKDKADLVYFVGCVTSYSGRVQGVASALTTILNHVGEDWTLLKDEWCCGHPLKIAGAVKTFKEIAERNVKTIEATDAKRVVSGCPGCCLALKKEYAEVLGREPRFEVIHSTQLLDEYIKSGRLEMPHLEGKVTYHDPCELGRMLGIFDPPRRVISPMNGGLVEPQENREDGLCCGAGGLLKAVDMPLSQRIADKRFGELVKTGAEIIVSACPSCDQNLIEAATRVEKAPRVVDIAELVAQQLGLV